MSAASFYERTESGALVCMVCRGYVGAHRPACAVVALHAQVRELAAQLGMHVATMHETLGAVDALLRGAAPEEVSRGAD